MGTHSPNDKRAAGHRAADRVSQLAIHGLTFADVTNQTIAARGVVGKFRPEFSGALKHAANRGRQYAAMKFEFDGGVEDGAKPARLHCILQRLGREEIDVLGAEFLKGRVLLDDQIAGIRNSDEDTTIVHHHVADAFHGAPKVFDVLQDPQSNDKIVGRVALRKTEYRSSFLSATRPTILS